LWQDYRVRNVTDEFGMTDFSARRVMMVDTQVRPSDVTKFPIIAAMLAVPREDYVPAGKREAAYMGGDVDLAPGRVMIEARTLAKMLEALDIQPTDRVLYLACGLGYGPAVIAELCDSVTGVEDVQALATAAQAQFDAVGNKRAKVRFGALTEGSSERFDAIMIEGGVESIGEGILDQLAEGGRIAAIFMQDALGTVKVGRKERGQMSWRFAFNASAPVLPGFSAMRGFKL
jgi:protein-L-isoaspartate(D-aspartate) O-methyltransferase